MVMVEMILKYYEEGIQKTITSKQLNGIDENNNKMANNALRVLAIAYKDVDRLPNKIDSENIEKELINYQFFFYIRFENIFANEYRLEIGDTQFFPRFPTEGVFYAFSIVDVAAYGSIPFSGLYIFM